MVVVGAVTVGTSITVEVGVIVLTIVSTSSVAFAVTVGVLVTVSVGVTVTVGAVLVTDVVELWDPAGSGSSFNPTLVNRDPLTPLRYGVGKLDPSPGATNEILSLASILCLEAK